MKPTASLPVISSSPPEVTLQTCPRLLLESCGNEYTLQPTDKTCMVRGVKNVTAIDCCCKKKNSTSLTETHSGSCLREAEAGPAGRLGHSGSCRWCPQAEAGAGRLSRANCGGATASGAQDQEAGKGDFSMGKGDQDC
jgi:hypothetical protein